jgi:hypothetical protein
MFCFHTFNGLKVRHGIANFPPNLVIYTVETQNAAILTYTYVCPQSNHNGLEYCKTMTAHPQTPTVNLMYICPKIVV